MIQVELDKVILGDMMDELPKLGEFADCIVTDPPYRTITGGDGNGANSVRPKGMLKGNRQLFIHQNDLTPEQWIPVCYAALKPHSHAYVFTNSMNMEQMLTASRNAGFKLHNILVWEKNNCTPSQYYMKNCEYVLFLRKGNVKWIKHMGGSKTVHKFDNIIGNKKHPTEKPVELMKFYVENSTNPGDIVLDPFMGGGSTGIACLESGRHFVGFEINEQYFKIADERISEAKNSGLYEEQMEIGGFYD